MFQGQPGLHSSAAPTAPIERSAVDCRANAYSQPALCILAYVMLSYAWLKWIGCQ